MDEHILEEQDVPSAQLELVTTAPSHGSVASSESSESTTSNHTDGGGAPVSESSTQPASIDNVEPIRHHDYMLRAGLPFAETIRDTLDVPEEFNEYEGEGAEASAGEGDCILVEFGYREEGEGENEDLEEVD